MFRDRQCPLGERLSEHDNNRSTALDLKNPRSGGLALTLKQILQSFRIFDAIHPNHIFQGLEDNNHCSSGPEQTQEQTQEWLKPAWSTSEFLTLT